jgi:membrane protein insertase Oxa1/YidC/SpoIIIJ
MSEIEKKTKEISEKWKTKIQKQEIEDMYKFYRENQVELFEDLEKLSLLCKLEELKQVQ